MKKPEKILSLALLIFLTAGVLYLSFELKKEKNYKISFITLEGESHLSKEEYFTFAGLNDRSRYGSLTLQIIKDRILKHPYIESADVRYDGFNKVTISIKEKSFEAILLENDTQYLVSKDLQLLPFFTNTKKADYPIIINLKDKNIREIGSLRKNKDAVTATKVIAGIKLLNPGLHNFLSTVDMRGGGDIVLLFSNVDYPVIIGRGNEIRKVAYFSSMWAFLKDKEINNFMDYIDLRYGGHIYLGVTEDTTLTAGELKS